MIKKKRYAAKIPKPARPRTVQVNSTTNVEAEGDTDDSDIDMDEDEMVLREMERRHEIAKNNVQQIRKEFGLT